jgi:hypothetical protein
MSTPADVDKKHKLCEENHCSGRYETGVNNMGTMIKCGLFVCDDCAKGHETTFICDCCHKMLCGCQIQLDGGDGERFCFTCSSYDYTAKTGKFAPIHCVMTLPK